MPLLVPSVLLSPLLSLPPFRPLRSSYFTDDFVFLKVSSFLGGFSGTVTWSEVSKAVSFRQFSCFFNKYSAHESEMQTDQSLSPGSATGAGTFCERVHTHALWQDRSLPLPRPTSLGDVGATAALSSCP